MLAPHIARAQASGNVRAVEPHPGDCDSVLNALLDGCERQGIAFGPALAFLDQFGYGAVSMDLIRRILKFGQCEVFSYLDYRDMNRWITDPTKAAAFTRAYGGQEWREAINLPQRERTKFLLDQYKAALKDPNCGNAAYVTSFSMFDRSSQPLYWLMFCTNNLRGLEEMKRAMWAVDKTGEFRFSDQDNPSQLRLFSESFDQVWLAEELARRLGGNTMSAYKVKEFVLTGTPCYLFKAALKSLEVGKKKRAKVTKAPPGRKPGTYPDEQLEQIEVAFESSLFGS